MRNILYYSQLFESKSEYPGFVDPLDFATKAGFRSDEADIIAQWWNNNRGNVKIHYFPFKSTQPIAGVFLGDNDVAINSRMNTPKEIKLFLALHESKHADQYREGDFDPLYFEPVLNDDLALFNRGYNQLETEANDFGVWAMRDLGFNGFIESNERMLRGNELAGKMVFNMMKEDIKKYNPDSFVDLIKAQVL